MSKIIGGLIIAMQATDEEMRLTEGFTEAERYFYLVDMRQKKGQVMFPTNFVHRLWNRIRN